jgi:hypothetical protein
MVRMQVNPLGDLGRPTIKSMDTWSLKEFRGILFG